MSPGEAFIEFNSAHHLHGNVRFQKKFRCETYVPLSVGVEENIWYGLVQKAQRILFQDFDK